MKMKEDYIRYKLTKADESLRAAELLMNNKFYPDAISKIYYAAFYSINALLAEKNLNPKTHLGVKSLFHKEFIFTNQLDVSFANLYDNLLAKRFEADYEYFPFIDESKIPEQFLKVKELIHIIKEKLQMNVTD